MKPIRELSDKDFCFKKSEDRVHRDILNKVFPIGAICLVKPNFFRWKKIFYKQPSGDDAQCFIRTK
jgi:hypothetical protein